MPAKVFSASICGFECKTVEIEVDILNGLSSIIIVGLGDSSVQESKERIRSAIKNSELEYPRRKKTINMAPADVRKHGPMYDLPIALGLLTQSEQIPEAALDDTLVVGELALNGNVRRIPGTLLIADYAARKGYKKIIVPAANAAEAAVVDGIQVIAAPTLKEVVAYLRGLKSIEPMPRSEPDPDDETFQWFFEDICGHEEAKRALAIAAAGLHNVLLYGPPGSGKTMLARATQSILPPLTFDAAIEVTKLYSLAGKLTEEKSLIYAPPFRSIHHTASSVSLIGGGAFPRPGEASLSHRGILFLDELLEFPRSTLDCLRQPLEDGVTHITRVAGSISYPSEFMLLAATNPCPCGYLGDSYKHCRCAPHMVSQYHKKLSGPLLDRIDIVLHIPRIPAMQLSLTSQNTTSASLKRMVLTARAMQKKRASTKLNYNGRLTIQEIKSFCVLQKEAETLLHDAFAAQGYSNRAYHRILKVARTIADIEESEKIEARHVAEALHYRPREFLT